MQRYFLDDQAMKNGNKAVIQGDDHHHIVRVMRMKPGDKVQVVVASIPYLAEIIAISETQVEVGILERVHDQSEAEIALTLLQGLPKGEKIDLVIRQAAEIGVAEIIVFQAERSVAKMAGDKREAKLLRWRKIAKEAAELAHRTVIPEVKFADSLKSALSILDPKTLKLLPYELQNGGLPSLKEVLRSVAIPSSAAFVIGPEGGFTEEEVQLAEASDWRLLTLGKRILRTETAGLVVASLLLYEWDQMGVN